MVNFRKICFICCTNDHEALEECRKYVDSLILPLNFTLDWVIITEATSLTSGYNQGMRQSDAKYKVYLHQDVLIINRNFLLDVIKLFEDNRDVGMMGVIGAKSLPLNGVWWETKEKIGKVYDSINGRMTLSDYSGVTGSFAKVQAVDGLLLATQYDLPWREDIFDGWHFYDISQCMEFSRAGFKVVVPYQEQPWCMHDCGVVAMGLEYEKARELFCRQYMQG
jgi:hypothetical protein